MPILNYTTTISTEKTAAEIQRNLADAKAQAVLCEYDENGVMNAMSFRIMVPTLLSFRLPANTDGVYNALRKNPKTPAKLKSKEQAARVAWRIVKEWVEAQLAIVEAGIAAIEEVFLPYAQNQSGQTLYESIKGNGFKLLTDNKTPDK